MGSVLSRYDFGPEGPLFYIPREEYDDAHLEGGAGIPALRKQLPPVLRRRLWASEATCHNTLPSPSGWNSGCLDAASSTVRIVRRRLTFQRADTCQTDELLQKVGDEPYYSKVSHFGAKAADEGTLRDIASGPVACGWRTSNGYGTASACFLVQSHQCAALGVATVLC